MPKVDFIKESDAPAAPKVMTKPAQASFAILQGIDKGMVAKVTPDKGQTVRSVRSSLSRVAKNNDIKITLWEVDGVLYVSKA